MKLVVIEPRASGGMIHYAYQLCNALSLYSTDVTLVTAKKYELERYSHSFQVVKLFNLWGRDDTRTYAWPQNRIRRSTWVLYRSVRRAFRGIRFFLEWIKLTRYLLKTKPDIVQFGAIEFPLEAVFLQYLKSRGLFLTQICHEFEPREKSDSLLVRTNNSLLSQAFKSFAIMFFHSPSNLARFRELYPEVGQPEFHLIDMGNAQVFPDSGDQTAIKRTLLDRYSLVGSEKVILFFGNITPSKGVPDLLKAFQKIHFQNVNTHLVIAGMPLKYINMNDLFELAEGLGIRAVTSFDTRYIPIEEVGPLMELATLAVFPYLNSTQSASLQVAYAFGKPVIATRVGGLPDLVVDGESGYLVDPNSPDQLADAILKLVNDSQLVDQMGKFAKKLSESRYSWPPIARKILEVYQSAFIKSIHHDHKVVALP